MAFLDNCVDLPTLLVDLFLDCLLNSGRSACLTQVFGRLCSRQRCFPLFGRGLWLVEHDKLRYRVLPSELRV